MNKTLFSKYHANGNDFILISSENLPKKHCESLLISRLCNRQTGIGADGLFFISPSEKYDFFLDYYNADGSWETFCANGSRCAAKFMYRLSNSKSSLCFKTGAGVHSYKICSNGQVSMDMKIPIYKSEVIAPLGLGIKGYFIDSGARHFVCESECLDDKYVFETGFKLRNALEFKPHGINVNFYRLIDSSRIQIKTYEKGVERVMLSCASGSAAVVFHLAQKGLITSPVTTISDGGSLSYKFDSGWENFNSIGPAEFCFSGMFCLEDYL